MTDDREMDALEADIEGLIKQATTKRLHYYTANVLRACAAAIRQLREERDRARNLLPQAARSAQERRDD